MRLIPFALMGIFVLHICSLLELDGSALRFIIVIIS